jgi:hypothetical protein
LTQHPYYSIVVQEVAMGFVRVLREFERDGVRVVAREHVVSDGVGPDGPTIDATRTYTVEASVASEFHSRSAAASEEDAKWKAERLFDAIYLREYGEGPRSPVRAYDEGVSLSGVTERG